MQKKLHMDLDKIGAIDFYELLVGIRIDYIKHFRAI